MTNQENISDAIKHSAAHILATAVTRLYPDAKVGIGPVNKDGFYYDFDIGKNLTSADLQKIENEANKIIGEALPLQQIVITKEEATKMLLQRGQIYKAELLKAIPDAEVSFYKIGEEFVDLCRGPHISTTNMVGFIKITGKEIVYWQNQQNRPQLQRIFGKVYLSLNDYLEYEKVQEEIKKRDFVLISEKLGIGYRSGKMFFLTEYGSSIITKISEIVSKSINFESSREITLFHLEDLDVLPKAIQKFTVKRNVSTKDYPLKFVGSFTSKDVIAKDYTLFSQQLFFAVVVGNISNLNPSVGEILDKVFNVFKELNIDVFADITSNNLDDSLISTISDFLQRKIVSHNKVISSGGTNIQLDFFTKDALEQTWSIGKLDFYSEEKNPLVIFTIDLLQVLAYLLENSNGMLPITYVPVQVKVLPFGKKFEAACEEVCEFIKSRGFRSEVDKRSKSIQAKIRLAEEQDTPITLIIGNKEIVNNSVSVRFNHQVVGLVSMDKIIDYISDTVESYNK